MIEFLLTSINHLDTSLHPPPHFVQIQTALSQDCYLEAQWHPLMQFVRDDLLSYEVVTGGAVIFSHTNPSTSKKKVNSANGDPGYPRPLTQYVIVIKSPSELAQLSTIPDKRILDELVKLLNVPNRGWAANILISKLLGQAFVSSDSPERWWKEDGKTGKAKIFWANYIQMVKPTMKWKSDWGYYKHIAPNGRVVEYCSQSEVCILPSPKK